MTIRLFIAEKPSLAQAIAGQLPGNKSRAKTHITVGSDIVTWCFGHILEQAMPEHYNAAWQKWDTKDLPIVPAEWKLLPKESARAQLTAIRDLLKKADIIVNAGDPDREGQLLVDEVLHYFQNKKPVKRILVNDYNESKVQLALTSLKNNEDAQFRGWYQSALARARFDWLFGLNLTRAYTLAARQSGYSGVLSVGRVQTPTLSLVMARDLIIENFKPAPFYTLTANFQHSNGKFFANWKSKPDQVGLDESGRLIDLKLAQALADKVNNQPGKIIKYEKTSKNEAAPSLFSLSGLIKAANSRYGYAAQAVLDTCQSLYETHKLTTYPRTDCEYVSLAQHAEAAEILNAIAQNLPLLKPLVANADPSRQSAAFNDAKITAHHAIVPTIRKIDNINHLSEMEKNIYDLIVRVYLAQFFPPYQYLQTTIEIQVEEEHFIANGKTPITQGWKEVYGALKDESEQAEEEGENKKGREKESTQTLPTMQSGDDAHCLGCQVNHRQTTPPPRFTEGSLQEAMKDVHRFVTNPDIKKRLKEGQGIGTEATRPGIIEELKKRNFIQPEKKGSKKIISSQIARKFIVALPTTAKDPALTAICEQALNLVADGSLSCEDFLARNLTLITKLIKDSETAQFSKLAAETIPCKKCNTGKLNRFKGKKGFFWVCSHSRSETQKCDALYSDKAGKPDFAPVKKKVIKKRRK